MYFDDYKNHSECKIDNRLFWEYDMKDFDFTKMKSRVVERVLGYGKKSDYYAMFNMYGIEEVIRIIKELPFLTLKNMNFVCAIFDIKKEDLRCYQKMLSMKKPIFY